MNRKQLREMAALARQLADYLSAESHLADGNVDPLGIYIMRARRRYSQVSLANRSKSRRDCKHEAWRSFLNAQQLGYRGDLDSWWLLLNWGISLADLQRLKADPQRPPELPRDNA